MKGENNVTVKITGNPKEIAALVLAVQERQAETVVKTADWGGNTTVMPEEC